MKTDRQSIFLMLLVCTVVTGFGASSLAGQAQRGLVIGIGLGRQLSQQPILDAQGTEPEYWLGDDAANSAQLEYWFTPSVAARLAYQWVRTDIEEPEIDSFVRIYTLFGSAIVAPLLIAKRVRPYITVGAGLRRYDVNATIGTPGDTYDIAPLQYRPAGYGAFGTIVRIRRIEFVPEAGVFVNTFEPTRGTAPTQTDVILSLKFQAR
jgi:hypothetical protein